MAAFIRGETIDAPWKLASVVIRNPQRRLRLELKTQVMHADILIDHGHYQMEVETLSYAQSLRVIGQQLDGLGVDSFKLDKRGDEYIVQMDESESAENLSCEKAYSRITHEKIRGSRNF